MSIKPVKTGAPKNAPAPETPEEKDKSTPSDTTSLYVKDGDLVAKVNDAAEYVVATKEPATPEEIALAEMPPTKGYSGAGSSTTFVKCRAIRTVLGRGLPHFPGEEFYQFEDAALEAAERGDLEIL